MTSKLVNVMETSKLFDVHERQLFDSTFTLNAHVNVTFAVKKVGRPSGRPHACLTSLDVQLYLLVCVERYDRWCRVLREEAV